MKKRSRTAKPRAKRDVGVADGPTPEWRAHHDAVVEDRDIKGTRGVRALSQNAFDRYYRRGELAPGDKKENMRRYVAGERLRADWERSGLDTRARQTFERREGGSAEDFSAARVDAYNRVREAMGVLGPTRNVVVNAAVYGDRVGREKMEMLRAGLDALADMYFGKRRA
ncbi:MAG: hypothetical protein HN719_08790 [Alphaproteobacteria bacterium]|nr:hypothetical protein [Alphaproteobacteria bacterium]